MLSWSCFKLVVLAATILDKADDAVDPQNGTIGKPDPSDIIDSIARSDYFSVRTSRGTFVMIHETFYVRI